MTTAQYKPGTLVALLDRGERETNPIRKVALVMHATGRARDDGRIRVRLWSHSSKRWSRPIYESQSNMVLAPADWPQTRSARVLVNETWIS